MYTMTNDTYASSEANRTQREESVLSIQTRAPLSLLSKHHNSQKELLKIAVSVNELTLTRDVRRGERTRSGES